jgi:hypothetical protein
VEILVEEWLNVERALKIHKERYLLQTDGGQTK